MKNASTEWSRGLSQAARNTITRVASVYSALNHPIAAIARRLSAAC
jgi:hypothetical protein